MSAQCRCLDCAPTDAVPSSQPTVEAHRKYSTRRPILLVLPCIVSKNVTTAIFPKLIDIKVVAFPTHTQNMAFEKSWSDSLLA